MAGGGTVSASFLPLSARSSSCCWSGEWCDNLSLCAWYLVYLELEMDVALDR